MYLSTHHNGRIATVHCTGWEGRQENCLDMWTKCLEEESILISRYDEDRSCIEEARSLVGYDGDEFIARRNNHTDDLYCYGVDYRGISYE